MRAGWSVGLGVLAKAARKATRKISTNSREGVEPGETKSQAYVSSRRPSLQGPPPVTSVRSSAKHNVVYLPLDSFDIGTFLRELDALRRRMTETATAFDRVGEKRGVAVPARRRSVSHGDPVSMNDALARAVKRLRKSRY